MKNHLHDSDYALFRAEVEDAIPLQREQADQVEPFRERPPPIPRPRIEEPGEACVPPLAESEIETPEYLLFARPGIQRRVVHELQRGRIEPALDLDLHGMTTAHAQTLLRAFLADCAERRVRCARIVHGKGGARPSASRC